jgi:hypothetical protein
VAVRVFVAALAVPAFALGLAIAAGELMKGKTVPVAQPTSIIWADRVYVSKPDLAKWLRARGASYDAWAEKHESMAAVLEGRQPAPSSEQPAANVAARELSGAERAGESKRLGPAIGLITASLLGLLALTVMLRRRIPPPVFARFRRDVGQRGPPRRPLALRIDVRASLAALMRSASTARQALAEVEVHLRPPARVPRAECGAYDRYGLRESLHRNAPDIAFCLVSVLLAVAVGISLALYLK